MTDLGINEFADVAPSPESKRASTMGGLEELLRKIAYEEAVRAFNHICSPDLLNEKEAAKYLQVQLQTLATWRHQGKGPPYITKGFTVLYERIEFDAYVQEGTVS